MKEVARAEKLVSTTQVVLPERRTITVIRGRVDATITLSRLWPVGIIAVPRGPSVGRIRGPREALGRRAWSSGDHLARPRR